MSTLLPTAAVLVPLTTKLLSVVLKSPAVPVSSVMAVMLMALLALGSVTSVLPGLTVGSGLTVVLLSISRACCVALPASLPAASTSEASIL